MNILANSVFGSKLYGTSTPSSDDDFRGVYIPERSDLILQRVQDVISLPGDSQMFSIHKFMNMLCSGQAVAIEMLFSNQLVADSDRWQEIVRNRHRFVTKRMSAFMGYAKSMASKYSVRADRRHDISILRQFLADCDGRAKISSIWDSLPVGTWMTKTTSETTRTEDKRVYNVCGREYTAHTYVSHLYECVDGIYAEYGKRVQSIQDGNIDYKAVMHAFRVTRQCEELLRTGELKFPLSSAEELLRIRLGEVRDVSLLQSLQDEVASVEEQIQQSSLRDSADRIWADQFILSLY